MVCGKGGNGGDGFVAARWLKKWGARPEVLLAFPEGEIGGDAAEMLRALKRTGVRPWPVEDEGAAAEALASAHVVVDALLGTGARGAPEGLVARLIELINASDRPVVALDVPSGAPADGEAPAGPAVRCRRKPIPLSRITSSNSSRPTKPKAFRFTPSLCRTSR